MLTICDIKTFEKGVKILELKDIVQLETNPKITSFKMVPPPPKKGVFRGGGASLFYIIFKLAKRGGGGYPQALSEVVTL